MRYINLRFTYLLTYLQAYSHGNRMTYDRILVTRSSLTSRDHMPDEVRRWRTKCHN